MFSINGPEGAEAKSRPVKYSTGALHLPVPPFPPSRGPILWNIFSKFPVFVIHIGAAGLDQSKIVLPLTPKRIILTSFPVLIKRQVSRHGGKVGPLAKETR